MEEINKMDAESLRAALELYRKEILASKKYDELTSHYSDSLEDAIEVSGIRYDKMPLTKNNNESVANLLVIKKTSCEQESMNHLKKAKEIRRIYRFNDRMKNLHQRDKKILYDIYFLGKSQKEIAYQRNKSAKTISACVSIAIKHMSEVEL